MHSEVEGCFKNLGHFKVLGFFVFALSVLKLRNIWKILDTLKFLDMLLRCWTLSDQCVTLRHLYNMLLLD